MIQQQRSIVLTYFASWDIVRFITCNPINWHNKDAASFRGLGDRAGIPPTSSAIEFFTFVQQRQKIPTQAEFFAHCLESWRQTSPAWFSQLTEDDRYGLEAKAYRNFYPSFIDSLHANSLLIESGKINKCVLSPHEDAIRKRDLIVSFKNDKVVVFQFSYESHPQIRAYKSIHRPCSTPEAYPTFSILLPEARPRKPGNKRWYCLKDFEAAFKEIIEAKTLLDMYAVPCTCGHHGKG